MAQLVVKKQDAAQRLQHVAVPMGVEHVATIQKNVVVVSVAMVYVHQTALPVAQKINCVEANAVQQILVGGNVAKGNIHLVPNLSLTNVAMTVRHVKL